MSAGVTLPELLVALVLAGVLAAGSAQVLRDATLTTRAGAQAAEIHQALRVTNALADDLLELDAVDGDLVAIAPSSVSLRASRWLAFACRPAHLGGAGDSTAITVRASPLFGLRSFDASTDSVFLLDPGIMLMEPRWAAAALRSVDRDRCPDGSAGQRLDLTAPSGPGVVVPVGAPVMGFEIVSYLLYRGSDGAWYVGMNEAGGGSVQPLIGPVAAGGLHFTYVDSIGEETSDPARVVAVALQVTGLGTRPVRDRGGALAVPLDSVRRWLWLRNNRAGSP